MMLRDILRERATRIAARWARSSCIFPIRPPSAGSEQRLESTFSAPVFSTEEKRHILQQLTESEGLERYLHTKYVGQKRFSLEGGEASSPDGRGGQPRRRIGRAGNRGRHWPTAAA